MRQLRLSIVGFGTVGRWLAAAVHRRRAWLEAKCGVAVTLVSVATRRNGFIHRDAGLDIPNLLELVAANRPLSDYPGTRRWDSALAGLAQTERDILAEASNTNPREPEPALSHIRLALEHGTHVITSSKVGLMRSPRHEYRSWRTPRTHKPYAEWAHAYGFPIAATSKGALLRPPPPCSFSAEVLGAWLRATCA